MISLETDFFALFGLPRRFEIVRADLEKAYFDLQDKVHPDRFAHLSGTEKRLSMHWATRVNEGWRTLKSPLQRAIYLLSLAGVDVGLESNTAMAPAFLMAQMEWREQLDDARRAADFEALEALAQELQHEARGMQQVLAQALDQQQDYALAAETVRRLMFIDKLSSEVEDAMAAV